MSNKFFIKHSALFFLFTFYGAFAMSAEIIFNKSVIEGFQKEINYSLLLQQRPAEKWVVLDWEKALAQFVDAKGNHWVGKFTDPYINTMGLGMLDGQLISGNNKIKVKVTSLVGDWQQHLDYVVRELTYSDAMDINAKVEANKADLYFIPKHSPRSKFANFLYGNFYISLTLWESGDVDPVAQKLLQLMQHNSRSTLNLDSKPFALAVDKTHIGVGDMLTVSLNNLAFNWDSEWIFLQPNGLIGKELERVEKADKVYKFKGIQPGTAKVSFVAMQRHSLLLTTETIAVSIK